jgi:hypothetical protein
VGSILTKSSRLLGRLTAVVCATAGLASCGVGAGQDGTIETEPANEPASTESRDGPFGMCRDAVERTLPGFTVGAAIDTFPSNPGPEFGIEEPAVICVAAGRQGQFNWIAILQDGSKLKYVSGPDGKPVLDG